MSLALDWPIERVRADFPVLNQTIHGYPLAYLDNAATTQKPQCVIDTISTYYEKNNANVHRGVHTLSVRATEAYEQARIGVANFIHAVSPNECIFVRGATEGINLVAHSYAMTHLKENDEILITYLEHHSNIVPWQQVCEKTGAKLKVAPISPEGELCLPSFTSLLTERTKLVALTHASNALGVMNPVKKLVQLAHQVGAKVLVDGAQAVPHVPVDVQDLGCDFYVFSGHKVFAPTGIGILWGKQSLLDDMSPYQSGGDMIKTVSFEKTEYADLPAKFEAGTPNISGAIGLGKALEYLKSLDTHALLAYENRLLEYATEALIALGDFKIIGRSDEKVGVLSFVHPVIHPHDIGTILDSYGIAIRSGHHCAMPLMAYFKVPAMSRMSLCFYNTQEEIDRTIQALIKVKAMFL